MVNLQMRHSKSEDTRHNATPVHVKDSRPSRLKGKRVSEAVFGLYLGDIVGVMN